MKKKRISQSLIFGALSLMLLIGGFSDLVAQAATIDVTSTADTYGNCSNLNQADNSLRLAICYANANAGDHIINLSTTTYTLTLAGSTEDGNATGDLDINIGAGNTLTINGNGATISANNNSNVGRVFHILSGIVVFNNVTITGGNSTGRGAGIYVVGNDVNLSLNNSTISNNTSTYDPGNGYGGGAGGIDNNGGIVTLTNCTVSGNQGRRNGGGIYTIDGTLQIYKSTITNNRATLANNGFGGGIYVREGGSAYLENSTISGNTAARTGGGIFAFSLSSSQSLTLHSCTVVNNSANYGGGISRWDTAGYESITPILTNTIIANNTATTGPDCYTNNINSNGYNLIENTTGFGGVLTTVATDITGQDPLLDALANNGGPTQTHALQSTSPAIDKGGSCLATDQRGEARPQGATCDIGAYEAAAGTPTPTPTTPALATPTPTPTTDPDATPTPTPTATVMPTPKPAWTDGLGSHTFPTYLLTASYDWLHNFNDRNTQATRGANQTDPDTDNFNKIIVADSNLFPIITAVAGDHEFPNITSRNTALYNDYFTRSIAVAPNFLHAWNIPYQKSRDDTKAYDSDDYGVKGVEQYGGRSLAEWTFVTDPGNHNIRRYEMSKIGDFWTSLEAGDELLGDFGGMLDGSSLSGQGVGQGDCSTCQQNFWYMAYLEDIFSKNANSLSSAQNTYNSNPVYYFNRDSGYTHPTTPAGWRVDGAQEGSGVLEFIITIPEDAMPLSDWKLNVGANSDDQSAPTLFLGLNARYEGGNPVDPPFNDAGYTPPTGYPADPEIEYCDLCPDGACSQPKVCAYENVGPSQGKYTHTYTISKVDQSYDLDTSRDGVQVRLSIFPTGNGGFILEGIQTEEADSAFAVKRDPAASTAADIEARWNKIDMYLETVPPESAPAYSSYATASTRKVGLGYTTNTSFSTADNVRFKNPRDVDVYRDVFDTRTSLTDADNGAPVYIFVADTMNSRIQVFMNATASAGQSNATFPVRPVRVKGPNDNAAATNFKSNELALRLYDSSDNSSGFGDGRKADWRPFINPTSVFRNITQGIAEFYYPHGVAVDQDPDTRDVYLFVADTFNHRIQVFRDATGVTFHNITSKRFDFEYEKGWGTYPANDARPGAYSFKYPKGIDVARFANNSSYLYVVDSKNYRVLKYLLTEKGTGGLNDPKIVAGFGYNGSSFSRTLTSLPGQKLEAHKAFEETGVGLQAVGFLNPQDVTTGYNGFYTYSGPMQVSGKQYPYQLDRGTGKSKRGIRYLNNYMIYVTDYARNNTSINRNRLNMRIMQFVDNYKTMTGIFLPWATTTTPTFTKGALWQSPLGISDGKYNSDGGGAGTGSTENAGREDYFTDRPVGLAAVTWDTISPIDMRVVDLASQTVYPNGASISKTKTLRVGVLARAFFGLPYSNITTYTNYTSQEYLLEGKGVKRVHAFCYDTTGKYVGYAVDDAAPFIFAPNGTTVTGGVQRPATCNAGYLKLIAEDKYFTYSGKTGTMIFQLTN